MSYNTTHSMITERALNRLKPGDFLFLNSGAAENNWTKVNADNALIRLISMSDFGHAALYLGDGRLMEMPLNRAKVKDVFAADLTNAAAFVHCKELTNSQRKDIINFADAYYKDRKGGLSYDMAAFAFAGLGEVANVPVKTANLLVTGNTTAGDITQPILQGPGTLASMLTGAAFYAFDKLPPLNCTSFVTYAHATAGHIIDDGIMSFPSHSTPARLWSVVRKDTKRFDVEIMSFFYDHKEKGAHEPAKKPDSVSAGNTPDIPVGPML